MSTRMVWPQIDPGKLVHKIALLKQVTVPDISGSKIIWVPWLTTWAEIEPIHGRDVLRSGQATTQLFLTVTIRWQPGVLANQRVQAENGAYVIQAIENPGERNILLILNCLALALNQ